MAIDKYFFQKKEEENGPNPERRVFYTAKRPSKIHDLMRKSSPKTEIFSLPESSHFKVQFTIVYCLSGNLKKKQH